MRTTTNNYTKCFPIYFPVGGKVLTDVCHRASFIRLLLWKLAFHDRGWFRKTPKKDNYIAIFKERKTLFPQAVYRPRTHPSMLYM